MELHGTAQQVWIFIGESDLWHGRSLYLSILETLKRNGCAGGTVFRGVGLLESVRHSRRADLVAAYPAGRIRRPSDHSSSQMCR
jgi:PII-like signaling protein